MIYAEGVFPTQGTRPLFTTIYQIINARLGRILNDVFVDGFVADTLVLAVNSSKAEKDQAAIQIDFMKTGVNIHQLIEQHQCCRT